MMAQRRMHGQRWNIGEKWSEYDIGDSHDPGGNEGKVGYRNDGCSCDGGGVCGDAVGAGGMCGKSDH